nr:hypothetical protein [Pedobacter sp. ASV2]
MLRLYKPIPVDPIFELHTLVEHLVCNVWCEANDRDFMLLVHPSFLPIINAYDWLKKDINDIYDDCKNLNNKQKNKIKKAFKVNNRIEDLCNGIIEPIPLSILPEIVEKKMKPLFVKFYEDLLNKAKVGGDKMKFYISLYKQNRFRYCPCCGYVAFESGNTDVREAYDHYLPKSEYPFSSINFKNLIPLCYKCNSERKKAKDPIENKQKAFYPYRTKKLDVKISTKISTGFAQSMYEKFVNNLDQENEALPKIADFEIILTSATESEQLKSWDRLFDIKERFSDRTGQFSFRVLDEMRTRFRIAKSKNAHATFTATIDENIGVFNSLFFEDENYLKVAFLSAIKDYKVIVNMYK